MASAAHLIHSTIAPATMTCTGSWGLRRREAFRIPHPHPLHRRARHLLPPVQGSRHTIARPVTFRATAIVFGPSIRASAQPTLPLARIRPIAITALWPSAGCARRMASAVRSTSTTATQGIGMSIKLSQRPAPLRHRRQCHLCPLRPLLPLRHRPCALRRLLLRLLLLSSTT